MKKLSTKEYNRLTAAAEMIADKVEDFSCIAVWRGSKSTFFKDSLVGYYAAFFGFGRSAVWGFDEHAFTGIHETIAEEDRVAKEARIMAILLFQHTGGKL